MVGIDCSGSNNGNIALIEYLEGKGYTGKVVIFGYILKEWITIPASNIDISYIHLPINYSELSIIINSLGKDTEKLATQQLPPVQLAPVVSSVLVNDIELHKKKTIEAHIKDICVNTLGLSIIQVGTSFFMDYVAYLVMEVISSNVTINGGKSLRDDRIKFPMCCSRLSVIRKTSANTVRMAIEKELIPLFNDEKSIAKWTADIFKIDNKFPLKIKSIGNFIDYCNAIYFTAVAVADSVLNNYGETITGRTNIRDFVVK